jgi:hypothetical protein
LLEWVNGCLLRSQLFGRGLAWLMILFTLHWGLSEVQMKFEIKNKKVQFFSGLSLILLAIIVIAVLVGNRPGIEYVEGPSDETASAGFSFFGVGPESRLTKAIRESLSDKLGSDTIERFGTIDLSLNYKGFLKHHFPELFALNNRLNDEIGARIEHNTLNISYRYPPKGEIPFDDVKLIFSNYTKKPLLVRIHAEQEGSSIVDTLTQKYGPPTVIPWEGKPGHSQYWRQGRNLLIASRYASRIGQPESRISIYFADNIDELLSREREEAFSRYENQKQAGTAF